MAHEIGNQKQVFLDWHLIEPGYGVSWGGERPTSWEMPFGVRISTHRPRIDARPLVAPEHPWESRINVYSTLFEDEGRFRLYYECYLVAERDQPDDLKAMLAYAESSDGVTWEKPTIGQVDFKGSKANNLVYGLDLARGRGAHGATVFKDPSAPPEERYKLVHMAREAKRLGVFGAVSPDGLHWSPIDQPVLNDYMSDTQTVVAFDPAKGRYVGYFRGWNGLHQGNWHGRRTIAYAETEDFRHWPVPEMIVEPDQHDGPDTDIYTNGYTAWPGAADAYLLFPAFYQRARDVLEVQLLTSRDGVRWERANREPVVPAGEPGSTWEGGVYAGCGLAALRPNEWSLPIGPQWHTHNQEHFEHGRIANPPHRGYVARAIWRKDGFTSLEASAEGRCTTVPLTFSGSQLEVNAWTHYGGELRLELIEANGAAIPGYSLAECDPISGEAANQTITWQGNPDLAAWASKPVRLRLWLRRARLHALQFR